MIKHEILQSNVKSNELQTQYVYQFQLDDNKFDCNFLSKEIENILIDYRRSTEQNKVISGFYGTYTYSRAKRITSLDGTCIEIPDNTTIHTKTNLFDSIIDVIKEKCLEVYNQDNSSSENYSFIPYESWCAKYQDGDMNDWHRHISENEFSYTSVYYTAVDGTPVCFENKTETGNLEIIPKNNMLLIFNAEVLHKVPKIQTNKPRIIFGANLKRI